VTPLKSAAAVCETVRHALGSQADPRVVSWYVRGEAYVVAVVSTRQSAPRLVVKLEYPGQRPQRRLDVMATLLELVRTRTPLPVADVVAVDVAQERLPWRYLIVTHLEGSTWSELYPRLDAAARQFAQRQIGAAAAHLHSLNFEAFGQIGPDGAVEDPSSATPALERRLQRRVKDPRSRAFFLDVLADRAAVFREPQPAVLCHEDLNPYNVLFDVVDGQPILSAVLDFESAWAGLADSDLARLELWRLTTGDAVVHGYTEIAPPPDGYAERRALLQLLWCLEYADSHPTAQHQADTDAVCRALDVSPIRFT
jgi:aminoglycoside phosphotransferase (APT) family kinase protein